MTPKEALEAIRVEFQSRLEFPVNLTPEYKLVKQALTELEELKRDVKRYFELEQTHCELHEIDEYYDLYEKLSKAGNEE